MIYSIRRFFFKLFYFVHKNIVKIFKIKTGILTFNQYSLSIFFKILKIVKKNFNIKYLGEKVQYSTDSDIGQNLFFFGNFEEDELKFCKNFLNKDSVIIDVGANIGLHSIYFSKLAKEGLIFSFEPSNEVFPILLTNTKNISNILPVNMGLADINTIRSFYYTDDNAYSSFIDTKRKKIFKVSNVVCIRLDDYLPNFNVKRLDFVKIDVEGLEFEVLKGMQKLIDAYHPIIFCEIFKGLNSNLYPEKTIEYITNFGYNPYVFKKNAVGLVVPQNYMQHDDKLYNYLFIPKNPEINLPL